MEQEYWEKFEQTGKIEDYLFYRGMEICQGIMERYDNSYRNGERSSESVDNGDRDDSVSITNRRI